MTAYFTQLYTSIYLLIHVIYYMYAYINKGILVQTQVMHAYYMQLLVYYKENIQTTIHMHTQLHSSKY